MFFIRHFFSVLLGLGVVSLGRTVYGANLAPDEAKALAEIGDQLGKRDWNFSVDPCSGEEGWATPNNTQNSVTCNCMTGKDNFCHVLSIVLVTQNLSGVLPPMLDRLPYLQEIDLGDNLLKGSIPPQWASLPLLNISLALNRLSGQIPKDLGKITSLTKLVLEGNQFSGNIPEELGSLVNLKRFIIATNNFTGELPQTLANLQSMEDLRVNENRFIGNIPNFVQYMTRLRVLFLSSNNFVGELPSTYAKLSNLNRFFLSDIPFTGKIPEFIQNWTQLEKLSIQGSGFKGPIPSGISHLEKLTDLRISDITGLDQKFPNLSKMKRMQYLVLRNCNISGQIPQYVWKMQDLTTLDLSFNKLTGKITNSYQLGRLDHMYLTNNLLSGSIPEWMLKSGKSFDFSDNSFMWENQMPSDCQRNKVNLFGSSSTGNNEIGVLPCLKKKTTCSEEYYSLNINCGGQEVTIAKETIYLADREPGGPSNFFRNQNWAVSSTGHFMDNPRSDEDIYTVANTSILSMSNSNLYTTARVSPLSLSYYGFCLRNGKYIVRLHFAEIIMIEEDASSNLGRRIFDVYLQDKLVLKDFNIKATAGGSGKVVMQNFTAVVASNTLEIRLYWSGKGTVSIPEKGTYGPLISAISVENDYPIPRGKKSYVAVAGIVAAILCSLFFVLGILWWRGYLRSKPNKEQDLRGFDLQAGKFTLRQIKAATNNFDSKNKIGEGGFGSVYKGLLSDGTIIAVKQLSSKSNQGVHEFVNEIGMISALQHPNLVKLYGCCIEGNQLLLIYEYMENNSLGRVLFGLNGNQLELNWSTRHKICVGIARGLAYLHEESPLKVVHRDIKATNILLDNNLNPKISDFGLAKLREEDNTHISTRVAGTIGYMAPEYAMRGYLTDKADVYSFGVVALEIISGRRQNDDHEYLVDWAYILQGRGALIELVDPRLGQEFNKEEALAMVNVALLCTNSSPVLRPMMSSVVRVLEGCSMVEGSILDPYFTDSTNNQQEERYGFRQTQALITPVERSWAGSSSTSCHDLYSITEGSHCSS